MSFLYQKIIEDVVASRPAAGDKGRVFFSTDEKKTYYDTGSAWVDVSDAGAVSSVAGHTGAVTLAESDITGLVSDLAAKAPLASPTFTGTPAAPTPTSGDNSTKIATTAFVTAAVGGGGGGGGSSSGWPAVTVVAPVSASFTQVNPSTATYGSSSTAMSILGPATAAVNLNCNVKSAPSPGGTGKWKVEVGLQNVCWSTNYNRGGVIFRESASGKLVTFCSSSSVAYNVDHFNSATSFASNPKAAGTYSQNAIYWLQMMYDGSNIYFSLSPDGINWQSFYSEAKNSFFTTAPDQVGFFVDSNNGTFPAMISVFHWKETSF